MSTRAQSGAPALRWPAEWEPHAGTWLAWPHAPDTWPGKLRAVERAFARVVSALAAHERVSILVGDEELERSARASLAECGVGEDADVAFLPVATNDAWIRDSGPTVVFDEAPPRERSRIAVDFPFDAWGGKYPPWDLDAAVPRELARLAGLPHRGRSVVLEGGSIDGDGDGTILTTEQCLLHPNRGSCNGTPRTRDALDRELAEALGARRVLWLARGIVGDDTDGHVDDIARFVAPGVVVAAVERDAGDENYPALRENRERLRGMRDASDRPLAIVELPMPPAVAVDGVRLPASYANFYLANAVALVPTFDVPSDLRALAVLSECLDGREVVPIPARDLVIGLGAVHCLTLQEPA